MENHVLIGSFQKLVRRAGHTERWPFLGSLPIDIHEFVGLFVDTRGLHSVQEIGEVLIIHYKSKTLP